VIDVEEFPDEQEGIPNKFQEKVLGPHEKELGQMIKSLFGLTNSQVACFLKLRAIGEGGTCVQNLVAQTSSERSVEQKKLKRLLSQGLVTRQQLSLAEFEDRCSHNKRDDLSPGTNKGYLYIYSAISNQALLDKITILLEDWHRFMGVLMELQQPSNEGN
jgi:predicted transcriptional regulator